MPETIHAPPVPVPVRGEAMVPLASFVRPFQRHYFSRLPERPNYRARSYDFAGLPALMPLVRAFLDTCAATETADYRYLFTLLGSELANNAIGHSLSGHPGGAYTHGSGLGVLQPDRASRPVRLEVVPPSRAQKVDVGAYGPGSKAVAHSHRSIPPYPWGGKVQVPGEPQTPTSNGYSWGVPSVVIRR